MRCDCCDAILTEYEMSFKVDGVPVMICMSCLDTIEEMAEKIEADAAKASEADLPLSEDGLYKFYERTWKF